MFRKSFTRTRNWLILLLNAASCIQLIHVLFFYSCRNFFAKRFIYYVVVAILHALTQYSSHKHNNTVILHVTSRHTILMSPRPRDVKFMHTAEALSRSV